MRGQTLVLSDQSETCSALQKRHPSYGEGHRLLPYAIITIRFYLIKNISYNYRLISFKASAFFNFFNLCGSKVHILMMESEKPTPHRELSSDILMQVTRLEQFIKLKNVQIMNSFRQPQYPTCTYKYWGCCQDRD